LCRQRLLVMLPLLSNRPWPSPSRGGSTPRIGSGTSSAEAHWR